MMLGFGARCFELPSFRERLMFLVMYVGEQFPSLTWTFGFSVRHCRMVMLYDTIDLIVMVHSM